MTARPSSPCPPSPATALPGAIRYVLPGAAALITDDGQAGTVETLQAGAECACALHGPPACLTTAPRCAWPAPAATSPFDTADPVIDHALDELPAYPPERQARLLTYAARRAGTTT